MEFFLNKPEGLEGGKGTATHCSTEHRPELVAVGHIQTQTFMLGTTLLSTRE